MPVSTSVTADVAAAPAGARVLAGPLLPGVVDAHSHAFQRAFAGLRPVVAHRASGRQFVVGTAAYELLQALERPTGLSDLQGWAASHRLAGTVQLEGILADLTARALVLEERGGRVRDGVHVTLPARRLFNAAPFDPAVDRGATVLLGVPFGAGNGTSSATANACALYVASSLHPRSASTSTAACSAVGCGRA